MQALGDIQLRRGARRPRVLDPIDLVEDTGTVLVQTLLPARRLQGTDHTQAHRRAHLIAQDLKQKQLTARPFREADRADA